MSQETADYNATVMDHFTNPRNVGELPGADAVGVVTNPVCGDMMKLYLKIEGDVVRAARFKTYGCGAAIAASSMATVMIVGRPLAEVRALTKERIAAALGGLPERKIHCSVLAEDALRDALGKYRAPASQGAGHAGPASS